MKLTHFVAVALLAVAAGVAVLPAVRVAAHADYDASTPGRGEQLAVAPTVVEITFTQDIQKIAGTYDITVNKDRGLNVTGGAAVVNDADRTKMSVPLVPDLDDGRYVVNWNNVSDADGDPNQGAFSFYLNHVPTAVDLANDAALEQIGPDETPAAGETPAGETPPATAPVSETADPSQAAGTQETGPTPEATPANGESDDGDSNAAVFIVIGVVVVVAIAGGAFALLRSRSS